MSFFIYFKSDFVKHVMFFSILNRFGQDFVKQVTATFRNKDQIQAGLRFFLLIFWNGLQRPISIFLLGSCSTPHVVEFFTSFHFLNTNPIISHFLIYILIYPIFLEKYLKITSQCYWHIVFNFGGRFKTIDTFKRRFKTVEVLTNFTKYL